MPRVGVRLLVLVAGLSTAAVLLPGRHQGVARAEERARRLLRLHVVAVGQGDGILLECPDGSIAMVVDAGDATESDGGVKAWKEYVGARVTASTTVPLVVASHPHADHIGGLAWLLRRNKVALVVDNGMDGSTKTYRDYADARDQSGHVARYQAIGVTPERVRLCGDAVTATLFAPELDATRCRRDQNRCSVLVRIDYGATSFMLTGDAEEAEERQLVRTTALATLLDVDVLKVGHHGSATSSSVAFLRAVSPRCAVISAGHPDRSAKNARISGYHLPRTTTLDALHDALAAELGRDLDKTATLTAWDTAARAWVDHPASPAVRLTARDGQVVIPSSGLAIACQ